MSVETDARRLAALFDRGNYTAVALSPRADLWQIPAAQGLIGLTGPAIAGLAGFDHPQARFYEAAALWIGGDDDRALHRLSGLATEPARRLRGLITRPRIPVLAMLAHGPDTCLVLRQGIASDPKFAVRTIGYQPGDLPNEPGMDLRQIVDPAQAPAFFLCQMIEWHQFPRGLAALPCPLIGQTSDFFVHIQSVKPWLELFDRIVVLDHTEHDAVSPLVSVPVASFPKSYGLPPGFPDYRPSDRPIDVLMTGTTMSPYHPDKADILRQLLALDGVELMVVNGHLGAAAYADLLSRSKLTVTHYRCGGVLMTRSIEAGALGCIPLVQRGNVLRLFAGPDPAVVDYDPKGEGVARAVREALGRYEALSPRLADTAAAVRAALGWRAVTAQYLRFCTVLAALSPPRRRPPFDPVPKRAMFWKGWCPGDGPFGNREVIRALRQANATRWRELPDGPTPLNERARDLLLDHVTTLLMQAPEPTLRDEALALWREGQSRWPLALAVRFNAVRMALHFGAADEQRAALALAREAVERGPAGWELEPLDDVLPYDFAGHWFNYRSYLDLVTEAVGGRPDAHAGLATLILASLAHYVAVCEDDEAMARKAVRLDPAFPAYRLGLARRLAAASGTAAQTVPLLRGLCREPLCAVEAWHTLRRLAAEGMDVGDLEGCGVLARRLATRLIDSEAYQLRLANPFIAALRLTRGGNRGAVVGRLRNVPGPRLSVIAVDRAGCGVRGLARALAAQTLARERFEVIYVELFERPTIAAAGFADVMIACNDDGPLPHPNRGANEGLLAATAPVVVVLDGEEPPDPGRLKRLVEALDGGAEAAFERDKDGGALAFQLAAGLRAGGFDPHHAHYSGQVRFEDLVRRLRLNGGSVDGAAVRDGDAPKSASDPMAWVRAQIFPGIDDPSRLRPRHEDARLAERLIGLERSRR